MTAGVGLAPPGGLVMRLRALSKGEITAVVILATALIVTLLAPFFPVLAVWPKAWTVPATEWIGTGLTAAMEAAKPSVRVVSSVLSYPMNGVNWALRSAPWPVVFCGFVALGWWIGGLRMAAMVTAALGFILLSGYWQKSMSTLALVAVSVPLALFIGLVIGVFAYKVAWMKRAVETVLDVMQTIPTFAYLTPLLFLFGFGPVVGLIASAIYAAPPMARNVLLGLERIEPDIREAAAMSGATAWQRLVLVELPAAAQQVLVGVNQCVMAALSMVIIAAVIGGFDDIGWEVLLTMRKAQFGQAFLAGLVIVVFAMLIDRMTAGLTEPESRGDTRMALIILGAGALLGILVGLTGLTANTDALGIMQPAATTLDEGLTSFTVANGALLDGLKNGAMFYGLLPLRIGLDDAVLPFTWGFQWTQGMSISFLGLAAAIGAAMIWSGRLAGGMLVLCGAGTLHEGITQLPWPVVVISLAAIGWRAGGRGLALFIAIALMAILVAGLWDRAMLSIYLCGAAVLICAVAGGALGLLAAVSPLAWRVLRPICDTLQTIPLFVFLIPMLMFFQIGEFSALLAICAYAIVPMIRYTRHGLVSTPEELMEAATASGATAWQIMRDVRAPYAAPTILLGLNQTILYAFAMLVIAALIGTTGLGQSIYIALGKADLGLGIAAGAAMALLALIADRLVQAFASERRQALGLQRLGTRRAGPRAPCRAVLPKGAAGFDPLPPAHEILHCGRRMPFGLSSCSAARHCALQGVVMGRSVRVLMRGNAARLDRMTILFALCVMFGELLFLATDIIGFRIAVLIAAIALIAVNVPRYGVREAYLLTFCGTLAVLAFTTSDDPFHVLESAFDQAIFLMAFILLVGLIQQAAQTSPSIRTCGLYLTRQPPGRRYFSLFIGTHAMAQLFNLGVVSLLSPLIMQGSAANADDSLQPLREQRQLNAMLRGFAWAVVWSPTAVAPLVVMTLLPEAQRGPWIAIGFLMAVIVMMIGWAEDRWTFRVIRRQLIAGVPRAVPPFPTSAFIRLGWICATLLALVILSMWLFEGTVIFGLMAASPVILVGWLLSQNRKAEEGAVAATRSRIAEIMREYLPRNAPLAVTLACSGFIGRAAAVLMPIEHWAEVMGLALMPGWLFLLSLSVGVAVLSQFALSPIMMAVFFGSLIAEIPVLPADVTWAALAISCGWALSMTISPFATVVLMMSQMTGHTGREMTWQWNWRFTLLCIAMMAIVYAILTGGT